MDSIEFLSRLGLARQIQKVRDQGLHAKRHFVISDGRFHRVVAAERLREGLVLPFQQREFCLLNSRVLICWLNVIDGIAVGL